MSSNRKRMGMFDHAKYSKPVLRSITEPVQRAVKRDINKLLDYDAASVRFRQPEILSDVSVVEDSFVQQQPQQQEEEEATEREKAHFQHQGRKKFCPEIVDLDKVPPIIWASSFRPPEKSLGLGYRDPSFTAVRDALLKAAPVRNRESPRMAAEERLAVLLNPGPQNQQCTPIQRCDDVTNAPVKQMYPSKCPLDRLAAHLMESFPTITLKNNEPLTLTDATFSMAKRALLAAQERHSVGMNSTCEDSSVSAPSVELNPLKSISDQTMCFFHASESEAHLSDDEIPEEISMDESPTADIYQQLNMDKESQQSVFATPLPPVYAPRCCDDGDPQPLFDFFGGDDAVDQNAMNGSFNFGSFMTNLSGPSENNGQHKQWGGVANAGDSQNDFNFNTFLDKADELNKEVTGGGLSDFNF